jgi:hypothetical protein
VPVQDNEHPPVHVPVQPLVHSEAQLSHPLLAGFAQLLMAAKPNTASPGTSFPRNSRRLKSDRLLFFSVAIVNSFWRYIHLFRLNFNIIIQGIIKQVFT